MTFKRFTPESNWQKAFFFSICLFAWPLFGLYRSPHIISPTAEGQKVSVVDVEYDLDVEEECNYCGERAHKTVMLIDWQIIHFCEKHFKKSNFRDVLE